MTGQDRGGAILFVLSAPSGAGKTTVAEALLDRMDNLCKSVSHTTRSPRQGEADGVDYHFIDERTFREMVDSGEFLEWAEVHGNFYGTSFLTVKKALEQGACDMLLVIDVQGARTIREKEVNSRSIFLLPPSMEELERRLAGRGTDPEEVIRRRLSEAAGEMAEKDKFDYVIVNDDLDTAVKAVANAIEKERAAGGQK